MADRVTPDEDAVLRRLHWFERFGAELAPAFRLMKAAIRARDKRAVIREPGDVWNRSRPVEQRVDQG